MVEQDFPASFYINKDNSALQLDHAVSQTQVEQHSAPWGFVSNTLLHQESLSFPVYSHMLGGAVYITNIYYRHGDQKAKSTWLCEAAQ